MSTFDNIVLNTSEGGIDLANSVITDVGTNDDGWYIKYNNGIVIGGSNENRTDIATSGLYGGGIYQGTFNVTLPVPLRDTNSLLCATCDMCHYGTGASWGTFLNILSVNSLQFRIFDCYSRAAGTNTRVKFHYIGYWK